ncbi:cytochrome P450 2D16-like [Cavia porcellus]|uniref:cytochrome P450 2D16-like n=1 Tax=Cavia porcellus TaxID=10141 RepID=UPI002FE1A0B9
MPCVSCQRTMLLANLSSVLKDESVWEKPLHFHPGHFLDAEGCFLKREAFMPFSASDYHAPGLVSLPGCLGEEELKPRCNCALCTPSGPCTCLGEPLARMELFLSFTSLLQHFSFSVPEGQPRPSERGVPAFIVTPSPYQLCAVLR